jgi:hypothetical protein
MRTALLVLALVACAACAEGGTPMSGDSRTLGDLTVTFRVEPAKLRAGSSVRFTLDVQNASGRESVLKFGSAQEYDFVVTSGGHEVWRWSSGRAFAQVQTEERIAGSSGKQFTETWRPDRPGSFTAAGLLAVGGFGTPLQGTLEVSR